MSQSRSAEELSNYVSKGRSVNGQSLDDDVQIDNVKSADKLSTARYINGVAFDGTKDIKVCGDTELPMQIKTLTKSGWYRFAHIYTTCTSAIVHITRCYAYGYPETYTLILDSTYDNCDFIQISSQRRSTDVLIPKIRVVYKNGTHYLEFYYNQDIGNTISTKISNIMKSLTIDTFSNVDFEEGSIPEGYAVKEFDLSASPIKTSSLEIGTTKLTETQLKALLALLT